MNYNSSFILESIRPDSHIFKDLIFHPNGKDLFSSTGDCFPLAKGKQDVLNSLSYLDSFICHNIIISVYNQNYLVPIHINSNNRVWEEDLSNYLDYSSELHISADFDSYTNDKFNCLFDIIRIYKKLNLFPPYYLLKLLLMKEEYCIFVNLETIPDDIQDIILLCVRQYRKIILNETEKIVSKINNFNLVDSLLYSCLDGDKVAFAALSDYELDNE